MYPSMFPSIFRNARVFNNDNVSKWNVKNQTYLNVLFLVLLQGAFWFIWGGGGVGVVHAPPPPIQTSECTISDCVEHYLFSLLTRVL